MSLLPQDLLVSMKLAAPEIGTWTYSSLSESLGMPRSAVHQSFKRACEAGLVVADRKLSMRANLAEFMVHGARYAFPGRLAGLSRGMPTAWFSDMFPGTSPTSVLDSPVWPCPHGTSKGMGLAPICPAVPVAALNDTWLHRLLVLLDCVRAGRARERRLASDMITETLSRKKKGKKE